MSDPALQAAAQAARRGHHRLAADLKAAVEKSRDERTEPVRESEPEVHCLLCDRVVVVQPYGNSFPPDIAKRQLKKNCSAAGCPSSPEYRVGVRFGRWGQ